VVFFLSSLPSGFCLTSFFTSSIPPRTPVCRPGRLEGSPFLPVEKDAAGGGSGGGRDFDAGAGGGASPGPLPASFGASFFAGAGTACAGAASLAFLASSRAWSLWALIFAISLRMSAISFPCWLMVSWAWRKRLFSIRSVLRETSFTSEGFLATLFAALLLRLCQPAMARSTTRTTTTERLMVFRFLGSSWFHLRLMDAMGPFSSCWVSCPKSI